MRWKSRAPQEVGAGRRLEACASTRERSDFVGVGNAGLECEVRRAPVGRARATLQRQGVWSVLCSLWNKNIADESGAQKPAQTSRLAQLARKACKGRLACTGVEAPAVAGLYEIYHMNVYIYIHIYLHIHKCTYMYVYIYINIYICTDVWHSAL